MSKKNVYQEEIKILSSFYADGTVEHKIMTAMGEVINNRKRLMQLKEILNKKISVINMHLNNIHYDKLDNLRTLINSMIAKEDEADSPRAEINEPGFSPENI